MTTVTPLPTRGCALIIGINDYRTFDPTGAHDLVGGAQDVIAVQRLCGLLGMAPEQVECLYDDLAGPGQQEAMPVKAGAAPTRQGIVAALGRLRARIEAGEKGILWYSGHGAWMKGEGLLLCPGDIAPGPGGKGFVNAIAFQELRELIGHEAAQNLTVVLDCCHGGPARDALGRRSTTLSPEPPDPVRWNRDYSLFIGATVLTACAPGETTQQSWFTGRPHGAFTWALLSAIDQWTVKRQSGGNAYVDLSYRRLVKAAMQLLTALEFEGTPQVWPQVQGSLAVLQLGDDNLGTSALPNADRHSVQLDPDTANGFDGTLYVFTLSYTDTNDQKQYVNAQALSCGNPGKDQQGNAYNGNTEYWVITSAFGSAWTEGGASREMTVAASPFNWPNVVGWSGNSTSQPQREANMAGNWRPCRVAPPTTTLWTGVCGVNFSSDGSAVTWYASQTPTGSYIINPSNAPRILFTGTWPASNSWVQLTM